jgi:hypothetical protein
VLSIVSVALLGLAGTAGPRLAVAQSETTGADRDGRFSFPHVQPGIYRVEAVAPGFEPRRQSVTVQLGRTKSLPNPGVEF